MKFIIDYDRRDFRPRLSQMDFRSLDDYTIDLQFVSKSVVFELEEPNTFTFCIKDRDNNALVFEESFTKVGTGDSLIYRIPVQFATVELAAFLGDSLYKDAYLSIRWSENGQYRSLPATKVRLYRSLVDGTELVNAGDPPYPPSEELLDFMNEVDFFLNSGNGNFVGAAINVDFATVNTTLNANSANITNSISVGSISGGAASFAILTAVTQANSDDSTLVATTEFVHNLTELRLPFLSTGTLEAIPTVGLSDGYLISASRTTGFSVFILRDFGGGPTPDSDGIFVIEPGDYHAVTNNKLWVSKTYSAGGARVRQMLFPGSSGDSNATYVEALASAFQTFLYLPSFDGVLTPVDNLNGGLVPGPYADDTAAAGNGVTIGFQYYDNTGVVRIRVS